MNQVKLKTQMSKRTRTTTQITIKATTWLNSNRCLKLLSNHSNRMAKLISRLLANNRHNLNIKSVRANSSQSKLLNRNHNKCFSNRFNSLCNTISKCPLNSSSSNRFRLLSSLKYLLSSNKYLFYINKI
jgi:hypothetical protein